MLILLKNMTINILTLNEYDIHMPLTSGYYLWIQKISDLHIEINKNWKCW